MDFKTVITTLKYVLKKEFSHKYVHNNCYTYVSISITIFQFISLFKNKLLKTILQSSQVYKNT